MSEAFRAEMKQAEEEDILSGSYVFFTAHTHTDTHEYWTRIQIRATGSVFTD